MIIMKVSISISKVRCRVPDLGIGISKVRYRLPD